MTHDNQPNTFTQLVQVLHESGFDGMAQAMEILLNEIMILERSAALNANPYERSSHRKGYANGFKPKTVNTRVGELHLQIPQTRDVEFYPSVLERGERSERALKLAVAEMYVQGVSTRKVTQITKELCGLDVTSTQVSRASKLLDEELEAWRNRPLSNVPYLILDARYEKMRYAGSVRDCAVLIAIGVREDGKRSVLGTSVSLSEAEVHWRDFLNSLIERGLRGVRYIVSDSHSGLKAARKACFASVPWQRCQFHLMQNAMSYIPKKSMQQEVTHDLRKVLNCDNSVDAQTNLSEIVKKYETTAPDLSKWMEENVVESFTVFSLPVNHRISMRTSNMAERLNKEIKRRTKVAALFPNEASILRLVSALLAETSEQWESRIRYLNMQDQPPKENKT